jgi:glucan 1,3-beta-glucosidase
MPTHTPRTGDGVTDDTAAINNAISSGNRCGPGPCASSTITPAVVYFPPGMYLVSSPIIDFYFTMLIGDAVDLPTLKASPNFGGTGLGVIDGDKVCIIPFWPSEHLASQVYWEMAKS